MHGETKMLSRSLLRGMQESIKLMRNFDAYLCDRPARSDASTENWSSKLGIATHNSSNLSFRLAHLVLQCKKVAFDMVSDHISEKVSEVDTLANRANTILQQRIQTRQVRRHGTAQLGRQRMEATSNCNEMAAAHSLHVKTASTSTSLSNSGTRGVHDGQQ